MAYGTVNADVISTSTSGGVLGAGNASIMKNRIINGAMVINQRGWSGTITTNGTYTLDRFNTITSVGSKFSVAQSSTAPTGFTNSLLATSLSAYTVGATEIFGLQQVIEGYNIADLGWGTANAKTVTLSFQVYSSLTGTFGGAIQNYASDRIYPFSYTVPSANTWTTVSITIAGDTTGTWATNNGGGLAVIWSLGSGTTRSGTAGVWGSTYYTSVTGATSVVGTSGATFYITGVQLEVGASATGFEYRQFTTELALCQRYFWTSGFGAGGVAYSMHGSGMVFDADSSDISVRYPVNMRAVPTVSFSSVDCSSGGTGKTVVAINDAGSTYTTAFLRCDHSTGFTVGYGAMIYNGNNANGYLRFTSEL